MVFLFPINMILHFCRKSKDDLQPKNILKDGISGITEKDDVHSRKYNSFSDRKIKNDKKIYSVK